MTLEGDAVQGITHLPMALAVHLAFLRSIVCGTFPTDTASRAPLRYEYPTSGHKPFTPADVVEATGS